MRCSIFFNSLILFVSGLFPLSAVADSGKERVASGFDTLRIHGDAAYSEQEYDQALTLYLQALENEPDSALLLNNVAVTLIRLGRVEESLSYSDRVIKLAAKGGAISKALLAGAYFNTGKAYESQSEYQKALEAYQQANTVEASDARDMAVKRMAYHLDRRNHALMSLSGIRFVSDPRFNSLDEYLGYNFCENFLQDFIAQKDIFYIMPDLITNDYDHPKIVAIRERSPWQKGSASELEDEWKDLRTTVARPLIITSAKSGYRLYYLELDGVSSNGKETVFYGDDTTPGDSLLRILRTGNTRQLTEYGLVFGYAITYEGKSSKISANEWILYKDVLFYVGYGAVGVDAAPPTII